ncbi:hypothetical protein MANES_11G043400v8 [Manihot esculenta]|uniref:Uncharacterized protein n=1 Tax=Manihot esculenta TaxID=3983 RepID=A0ACB7GTN2_MANES|nr:hypothetical protein MANES_11G043400v8 [Manihot esculenta]
MAPWGMKWADRWIKTRDPNESSSSSQNNRIHVSAFDNYQGIGPKKYSFSEAAEAADHFSIHNLLIDYGDFGEVYKGSLDGEIRAIRKLSNLPDVHSQADLERKIMAAGRLRHRNLLQLDGYCIDGANTLLIFKYFSNGSLKYNLHGKENILDWKKRRNIALDSSRGLEYLHEVVPGQSKITHLNIKSDNILLDDNFLPKLCSPTENIIGKTQVGKYSYKSDIYSFGVILLELITGRKAIDEGTDIVMWANPLIERALNREYADFVDSRLQSFDHEEMYRMIFCANICINQPPNSCPSMREIHLALQVSMPLGIALDEKKYNKLQLRATYKDDESSSYIEEENQRNNLEHYSYGELVEATEFFSNNRLVGEGASGAVYRGKLGKEVVAIKKFKIIVNEEQENLEDQFEIEVLTRIRHPNVVKLIGYCSEGSNRLLVLEYLMNKSLNSYLHGKKFLDWSSRLNIAIGSAKGILYLHKYGIIHRDIKTDNILLDNNLEPKIADFSLSKFLPNTDNISHITSVLKGTNIYVDPEYSSIQKVSAKSDIYSFGVVLLELITGRKLIDQQQNLDIITWTWREIEQAFGNGEYRAVVNSILQSYDEEKIKRMIVALVDSKLGKNYDEEQMKRMVFCAIACLNKYSKSRPRMQKIIEVLEGKIIPPQNILDGSDNKSIKYSRFRDN